MKKVLIAESGSGYGGSARYLADLVPRLSGQGFSVQVAAYGEGPFIQKLRGSGFQVHAFGRWQYTGIPQMGLLVPAIAWWLARHRIQLVHLNNEILSHLPLILAGRLAGCRTLVHLHGWRRLTRLERWASGCVDRFAAVTASGADFYSWQLGNRRVEAIPNGTNGDPHAAPSSQRRRQTREALGVTEGESLALLVGRVVPSKGHSVFLKALARARKSTPSLRGLIVGNDPSPGGTYERKLKEEADSLGIRPSVSFLPWQEHLGPFYEASDFVVVPSLQPEAFGYAALEAMAWGKPVVASRAGGLVDLVKTGQTGILVSPGDAGELARTLERLAGDRELVLRLGKSAQSWAGGFSMEKNAAQVAQLYTELCGS